MTLQQAIEKAIFTGEYLPQCLMGDLSKDAAGFWFLDPTYIDSALAEIHVLVLDPKFWEALGKSLKWERAEYEGEIYMEGWLCFWHYFIDHLAEGKTIESYFEYL